MSIILLNEHNKQTTRSSFLINLNKLTGIWKHRHELWLLTCYLDFQATRQLIKDFQKSLKLTDVYLLFNYSEIYRTRRPNEAKKELSKIEHWCANQSINFEWRPILGGRNILMHAKSYALIQRIGGELKGGYLFVTSANLTLPGFGSNSKKHNDNFNNIEIAYVSEKKNDLNNFIQLYNGLWENYSCSLDSAALKADKYLLKYALLSSGVFLHKWTLGLSSQISISYPLTDKAKETIFSIDPDIAKLGFNLEANNLTLQPLLKKLKKFSKRRVLPINFTKRYTIDTLLGRWCPNSIWNVVEEMVDKDGSFETFVELFQKETTPEALDKLVIESKKVENILLQKGIIVPDEERIERWYSKIIDLRENVDKLARLFIDYESFLLPYEAKYKDEIEDLYDSMIGTIDLMKNRNIVARCILEAVTEQNIDLLNIDEEEKNDLKLLIG
jgi:hypothetical protein